MKRSLSAAALCVVLLTIASLLIVHGTRAKQDPVLTLLKLPAPPPPNPIWPRNDARRDDTFYDHKNPPPDNAPIGDLIDYWTAQPGRVSGLEYKPTPSDRTTQRLLDEAERRPELLGRLLRILPANDRVADTVRRVYEHSASSRDGEERTELRRWLMYNSPMFVDDLERAARKVRDSGGYVTNQAELLALARVDFERAKPLIARLEADTSQPVSRALAKWALYRHALDTDSLGDIERLRDELKAIVEDKSNPDGLRDLANDALVHERDWPGRDEWFYSLFSDETLVNMPRFTGLTTLVLYSPPEKYVAKMIELTRSTNITVRTMAVRNLLIPLRRTSDPEIVRALLPWLENAKWITENANSRNAIVTALETIKMPDSVPGLVKLLDEKDRRPAYGSNSNAAATSSMNSNSTRAVVSNSGMAMTNASYVADSVYPHRYAALGALAFQRDARAIPALRRIYNQTEGYERQRVVTALHACGAFSAEEQVAAMEAFARAAPDISEPVDGPAVKDRADRLESLSGGDIKMQLGMHLMTLTEMEDDVVRAAISRIRVLDKRDPPIAGVLRSVVLKWQSDAVDQLLISDLRAGRVDPDSIVRLLARRENIRQKLAGDVLDLRDGPPAAAAVSACLIEDESDLDKVLAAGPDAARTMLFACGRLIRARIAVARAAEFLRSGDALLRLAAEKFLETEDSPEARRIVLSLHPDEALVLGAREYFEADDPSWEGGPWLETLLGTDGYSGPAYVEEEDGPRAPESEAPPDSEKHLRDEIRSDRQLLGVYSWADSVVRVYGDRVVLAWYEDKSRYRERVLRPEEFARLRDHLARSDVDDLKPFLGCGSSECLAPMQFVALGRAGGGCTRAQTACRNSLRRSIRY